MVRIQSPLTRERLTGETRDTKALVEKTSGACHKSFATEENALAFLKAGLAALQLHTEQKPEGQGAENSSSGLYRR